MGQIQVLTQETINQIAAGEVIERPSSVVKELVENAMDAGATAITVEIKDGGISLIRVTDNGSGIMKEDIPLAFLRHSTSKIRSVEDLLCIGSLGFRGEALSSIAAVAQVELITCAAGQTVGCRYRIEGGQELSLEEIGAPEGTTLLVRNLFYNTPVRRKFLKTPVTEGNYISELMERMALSHPDVSLRLLVNGQMKLHTAGNHNLKDIIYSTFGREITANLIPVEASGDILSVSGFIGKPVISRGNRSFEIYFINGRYIKSNIIYKAIEDAYKTFLMQHKYPMVVLHLTIEPEYLDVNVHPTKMELRFRGEQQIYEYLVSVIRDALLGRELIRDIKYDENQLSIPAPEKPQEKKLEPFEKHRLGLNAIERLKSPERARYQERSSQSDPLPTGMGKVQDAHSAAPGNQEASGVNGIRQTVETAERQKSPDRDGPGQDAGIPGIPGISGGLEPSDMGSIRQTLDGQGIRENSGYHPGYLPGNPTGSNVQPDKQASATPVYEQQNLFDEKLITPEKRRDFRIIGQLFETYWLLQVDRKFLIVDQHAAHEKILYERTMKRMESEMIPAQQLAPPIILTLTPMEIDVVTRYQDTFQRMGFTIEPFGGREYAVYSVPDHLFGIADQELLRDMIDELTQQTGKAGLKQLSDRIATASCKAAIKGNDEISLEEAETLLDELFTLENPYTCPHGRPTIISMSQYELDKKFRRIL